MKPSKQLQATVPPENAGKKIWDEFSRYADWDLIFYSKFFDHPWNWKIISARPDLDTARLLLDENENLFVLWDWNTILRRKDLNMAALEEALEITYDGDDMITDSYEDQLWDWTILRDRPDIPQRLLERYPIHFKYAYYMGYKTPTVLDLQRRFYCIGGWSWPHGKKAHGGGYYDIDTGDCGAEEDPRRYVNDSAIVVSDSKEAIESFHRLMKLDIKQNILTQYQKRIYDYPTKRMKRSRKDKERYRKLEEAHQKKVSERTRERTREFAGGETSSPKIITGPKGGRYYMKGNKKVYVK
jgi:hypothetical protein